MNHSLSPRSPMPPNNPPADVDRWLTAYFQAELPKPFPAVTATVAEPIRPRRAASQGRLTLAASVAALLGLGVSLSYGPTAIPAPDAGSGLLNDATADGKKLLKHLPPPPAPKLP